MNKQDQPKTQGKIEEKIKKEILFLSDHWTQEEQMPFNFGGWLDEVVTDIYKIHLKEQSALLQRIENKVKSLSKSSRDKGYSGLVDSDFLLEYIDNLKELKL